MARLFKDAKSFVDICQAAGGVLTALLTISVNLEARKAQDLRDAVGAGISSSSSKKLTPIQKIDVAARLRALGWEGLSALIKPTSESVNFVKWHMERLTQFPYADLKKEPWYTPRVLPKIFDDLCHIVSNEVVVLAVGKLAFSIAAHI